MKKIKELFQKIFGGKKSSSQSPFDFNEVDSLEKAKQLFDKGELHKILLFPREFGGEDIPPNVMYVPKGVPEVKDQITDTLVRFVEEDLIDNLEVNPEYKGKSFIPSRITMKTSHSGKAGEFNPTIEIW